MTKSAPIGLVGIGLMGEVLAGRLLAAGFSVLGYDVDSAKGERLAKMGGKAGSLAEVAQCSRVILAVFSTDQVEDVTQNSLVPAAAGTSKIVLCTDRKSTRLNSSH